MMTKTFAEEEAGALFRSQEIDKVNKEMLQLVMVISEKETGTAEAVASTGTSDELTKVPAPEDQGSSIDPLRLVDPWSRTTDGIGIKTSAAEFEKGTLPVGSKGHQWFFEHSGYYGHPDGKGQGCTSGTGDKGQGYGPLPWEKPYTRLPQAERSKWFFNQRVGL